MTPNTLYSIFFVHHHNWEKFLEKKRIDVEYDSLCERKFVNFNSVEISDMITDYWFAKLVMM